MNQQLKKLMIKKINKPGLYVHIPFCKNICSYCNFCKVLYSTKFSSKYLTCLKKELEKYHKYCFDSIYIGGGTPSSLSMEELQFLFDILSDYQSENCSITIEINPDIEREKILLLKKNNVNRISMGVQSFNKDILALINRNSDFSAIDELIKYIKDNGIEDINIDLIYGFNNQNINSLKEDLDQFISLNPTHISTYCLQLEDSTLLSINNYQELEEDKVAELYNFIVNYLEKHGYYRYEVSNFSKIGYESKHNLIYWNNDEYGGVGLNASSYIDDKRMTNTKNLTDYLNGKYEYYEENLNLEDKEFYYIMLGLRKEKGISLDEYQLLFNKDFISKYQDKIDKLIKLDDIEIINNYLKVKKDKLFILDYIIRIILY